METSVAHLPDVLREVVACIQPPPPADPFRARLDALTKPRGSLGRMEDLAVQMGRLGLLERELRKAVYVFAADHGIAEEGVSAYPQAVTRQMVLNFLEGGAAINVLGRLHGAAVHIVDAGVLGGFPENLLFLQSGMSAGSRNFSKEAAMSQQEFAASLLLGLECAEEAHSLGYTLVAAGEMGIGNTSSASAIASALTGAPLSSVTGRGTGLSDAARIRKISVLEQALALHSGALHTPAEVLRRIGGLELAAIAGFVVGCAACGIGVVVDGFIATAAVACALGMVPALRPFLFSGHLSEEPGHAILLAHCGLDPILSLGMRLGEGTGAVLAMPILESARAVYREMATFASAGIADATQ